MRRLVRRLKCDSCLTSLRLLIKRLAGMASNGWGAAAQGARFNANTAFNPPNANELLSTARTGTSRATFGT